MSAIKAVLGIGAAYLLYEWYTGAFNAPVATVANNGIPSSNTTVAAPPNVSQTQVATILPSNIASYGMPTVAQLQNAAGAQVQNIYQWNYWYNTLTGRGTGFNSVTFPVDGSTMVDAPTYLSYLKGLGLSGLGNFGHIINLEKLFAGVPVDSGFGGREFTALSGFKGIVDDALMSAAYIDEGPMFDAAQATTGDDPTTQDFFLAAQGQGS